MDLLETPTQHRPAFRQVQPVVGRLAPSPTGLLHLGHARTFLLAWWSARAQNGKVILRIEDLDTQRCRAEFTQAAREDLTWLGLDWDEEHLQSAGAPALMEAVHDLMTRGMAYPCVCSRGDILRAASAPHGTAGEVRYPGTCRSLTPTNAEATRAYRFVVPDEAVTVTDLLHGSLNVNVQAEIGDFVIARKDGAVAYQLAVVVDDARQGVTEVVRGDDLLPSTPRQMLLARALGFEAPRYFHVPLVVDERDQRLSKRHGAVTLRALRESGVSAETIVGWAARTSGQNDARRATAAEVVAGFEWGKLPITPITAPSVEELQGRQAPP